MIPGWNFWNFFLLTVNVIKWKRKVEYPGPLNKEPRILNPFSPGECHWGTLFSFFISFIYRNFVCLFLCKCLYTIRYICYISIFTNLLGTNNEIKRVKTIHGFFIRKPFFYLNLNFLNIMIEIRLTFS